MDTSYYESEDKKQRRTVVAIIALIAIVALSITVWAIISIVSSSDTTKIAESPEIAVDDPASEAPKTEGVTTASEAEEGTETPASNDIDSTEKTNISAGQSDSSSLATVSSVPETGPEDFLPLALLAGSGAAFVSSKRLTKDRTLA